MALLPPFWDLSAWRVASTLAGVHRAGLPPGYRKRAIYLTITASLQSGGGPDYGSSSDDESHLAIGLGIQKLAAGVRGHSFANPGHAYAAIRALLPPPLAARTRAAVRARAHAAHPKDPDPHLLHDLSLHLASLDRGGMCENGAGYGYVGTDAVNGGAAARNLNVDYDYGGIDDASGVDPAPVDVDMNRAKGSADPDHAPGDAPLHLDVDFDFIDIGRAMDSADPDYTSGDAPLNLNVDFDYVDINVGYDNGGIDDAGGVDPTPADVDTNRAIGSVDPDHASGDAPLNLDVDFDYIDIGRAMDSADPDYTSGDAPLSLDVDFDYVDIYTSIGSDYTVDAAPHNLGVDYDYIGIDRASDSEALCLDVDFDYSDVDAGAGMNSLRDRFRPGWSVDDGCAPSPGPRLPPSRDAKWLRKIHNARREQSRQQRAELLHELRPRAHLGFPDT